MRGYLIYERADATVNARFIQMLQEEATAQQIDLILIFAEEFEQHSPSIDFVWNRSRNAHIGAHYEQLGIRVFNNSETNAIANHKQLATEFVNTLGIQTVPCYAELSAIASFPVVLKTVDGHGGQEVVLCHKMEELHAAKASFKERMTIIQPFIKSDAQDVRIWMLGNSVLGAVLRSGANSFKSNYTLGGSIKKFELPEELLQAVLSITTALKSDYIGIDFIKGVDGQFYFNEIEDPVGARSYYDLFGHDLASKLMIYIKNHL